MRTKDVKKYDHVGAYLKEMRLQNTDLTQADVSWHLGWDTAQYVSNIERGVSGPPLNKASAWVGLVKGDLKFVRDMMVQEKINAIDTALGLLHGAVGKTE